MAKGTSHVASTRCGRHLLLATCIILFAAKCHATPAPSLTIVSATEDGLTLDFVLPELSVELDALGELALTFDGATASHCHECDQDGPRAPLHLPYLASLIGLPPDATSRITVSRVLRDTLDTASFAAIDGSFVGAPASNGPLATVEVLGYARDQYMASVKVHPLHWDGSQLQVTRQARLHVSFARPPSAPSQGLSLPPDSEPFERLYDELLLNPGQSVSWRARRRTTLAAPSSAFAGGVQGRVRLVVHATALHRLTPADLRSVGVTPEDIDPTTFRVMYRGDEVGADVVGVEDGVFNGSDGILFFGEAITRDRFTDENAYVLEWGQRPGLRPHVKNGALVTASAQSPISFRAPDYFEKDRIHDPLATVKGERVDHYFWVGFTGGVADVRKVTKTLPVQLPTEANDIPQTAILRIAFQGVGATTARHGVEVSLNGIRVAEARWIGQAPKFHERGFSQTFVRKSMNVQMTVLDENGTPPDKHDVYLDWFEIDYWRQMQYDPAGNGVLITSKTYPDVDPGPVQFHLSDFSVPDVFVYELDATGIIARFDNVSAELESNGTYDIGFEDIHTVPRRYIVATRYNVRRPGVFASPLADLKSPGNEVDYLIISHREFIDRVQQLADYRRGQGLAVKVVDVQTVYDEFSHGLFSPFAIQTFLRFAFQVWAKRPTYVLLVGDGHYGYKGAALTLYEEMGKRVDFYPNFVPTIHGWSQPFGETAIDQRFVNVHGDDLLPDMFIGRIPVQRQGELSDVIRKIIAYEENPEPGPWQARIVHASDDDLTNPGDSIFQTSREELIRNVIPPEYEVQRIYLAKIRSARRMKEQIKSAIQAGALIFEYAGHGGRGMWADEAVLRLPDLIELRNDHRQPLIVAGTCEMNFFDRPERFGERALGEEFLLGRTRGAIATIGATRLTFAICNAQFDTHLFHEFLNGTDTDVGGMLTRAKIRHVGFESITYCVPGVEQYTLFGDPAVRLLRPPLRANVTMDPLAVKPGQRLRLKQDIIVEPTDPPTKATAFDGELTITITYPNNLDDDDANDLPTQQAVLPVEGGEFGDAVFTVPAGVVPGEGLVRVYGAAFGTSAIGGERFSVRQPRIVSVSHEERDAGLVVTTEIANPDGLAGLKSVATRSLDTDTFRRRVTPMRHLGNLRFVSNEPIPYPGLGRRIEYVIVVTDTAGSVVESRPYLFHMPLGPDLAISEVGNTRIADLRYMFDRDADRWILEGTAINLGDERPGATADVLAIEGNGDVDGNWVLDEEVNILARDTVRIGDWRSAPADSGVFERAPIRLELDEALASGVHDITIWIDPARPNTEDYGRIEESFEFNNRSRKSFEVSAFVVGREETRAHSLDRSFHLTVPAGAAEPTSLSISLVPLPSREETTQGRDAPFAPVPLLRLSEARRTAFASNLQSGEVALKEPATVEIAFDRAALQQDFAAEMELPSDADGWSESERQAIEAAAEEAVSHAGIYAWLEDRAAWRYLESALQVDAAGEPVTSVHITPVLSNAAAEHGLEITTREIDPTATPTGNWAVLFQNATDYVVLFKPFGALSYQQLRARGRLGEPFGDLTVGIRTLIVNNHDPTVSAEGLPDPPEAGDVISFETGATNVGTVAMRSRHSENVGDGTAEVSLRDSITVENASYGHWIILLTDTDRYELRDGRGDPVFNPVGSPVTGEVDGRTLVVPSLGLRINVFAGTTPFRFGDTFRVQVGNVLTMEATTNRTGVFMLLHDRDVESPSLQLWVNGERKQDGSVIPPRPMIALLMSDLNGIDADTFQYAIRNVGSGGFKPVPPEDYVLNPEPIDQISVSHRPILFIGTYVLRVGVSDLAGTPLLDPNGELTEFVFVVEEDPDLDPPHLTLSTDDGEIADGDIVHFSPQQLVLDIRESHALDIDTLKIKVRFDGARPRAPDRYELTFDRTRPTTARAVWGVDLDNGVYEFLAQVTDTSTNVGHLGKDEATPLRITVDAPVHFEGEVLNAPNPFDPLNPVTRGTFFTYNLTQPAAQVTVRIYTVSGRLVRSLVQDSTLRGYNELYWDGRDEDGVLLANGAYFYKIRLESIYQGEGRLEDRIGKLAILR